MSGDRKIHVGSRKSELALIQTRYVIGKLKELHPNKEFEIITMSTLGDKVLDIPLPKIGEKSLFTKELEVALATRCVDFVVHSLKDLPTTLPDGMAIGAVLTREDARDALVLRKDCSALDLCTLPRDSVIGTSSLRRAAQLARKHPHLKVESIRGNLNTRLKKLDELGKFEGLILAAAGLHRMGWNDRISKIIDERELLYAVGQGALAVECRANDEETLDLLRPLYDIQTAIQITTERSFLRTLGGGCSAPVAVTTDLTSTHNNHYKIVLKGAVWSLDGQDEIIEEDNSIVIAKLERCAACPYKKSPVKGGGGSCGKEGSGACIKETSGSCSKNNCTKTDIECLQECSFKTKESLKCPYSNGGPRKKQKLDEGASHDVSLELLKDDPHEHCPIDIPVGLDFMGKCPYLEQNLVNISASKCPVNGEILGRADISKCPFMKDGKFQLDAGLLQMEGGKFQNGADKLQLDVANSSSEANKIDATNEAISGSDSKLFCGLVSHPDIPLETLKVARELGSRVAEKLMEKGAVEIMAKAQAHIRGTS